MRNMVKSFLEIELRNKDGIFHYIGDLCAAVNHVYHLCALSVVYERCWQSFQQIVGSVCVARGIPRVFWVS